MVLYLVKKGGNMKKIKIVCLVLVIIIAVIAISIGSVILGFTIRNNKINKQFMEYVDTENKTATSYNSGNNIKLSDEVYNKIMEEELDLVIINKNYIARIKNENVTQNIDIDIKVKKDETYNNAISVQISGANVSSLSINSASTIANARYLSEYYNDGTNDIFVANNVKVDEEGFCKLKLVENSQKYSVVYLELDLSQIENEELKINKGKNIKLDLGIDNQKYTYNSYTLESTDAENIQINEDNQITAKKVGEYTIVIKNTLESKELKLKVVQPIENINLSKATTEIIIENSEHIDMTILPEDATNKDVEWTSSDESIATVDGDGNITAVGIGTCQITVSTKEEPKVSSTIQVEVKEKPELTVPSLGPEVEGITYINGIMLVNKTHPVPRDYAPGLQPVAYNAFLELQSAAAQAGYDMPLLSGYRSYDLQTSLYNNYVATYGQAEADTFSARPGTSEHQTGLAMDVGWIDDAFANTPAGIWLAENCYKYGFIIRYQKNKESITGYKYEPWHIRYLGKDIAKDVYESGLCLEEYLGVN